MALSAPIFYDQVIYAIDLILVVFALVIEGVSFVHCLTQRSEAFPAIGTLPKGAWLAIIGGSMLFTVLLGFGPTSLFGLIGIAAAAIYLLDVRVGLRDLSDGKGFW
jgi:hypothetical protein